MMSQHLPIAPVTPRRQHHFGNLSTLWHTKEGSDITIRCGDGIELEAHRLVLTRSPWMAGTMEMGKPSPDTKMDYLQVEEHSPLVRPLVAFCYGVEVPPLKKGSKTETQLRILVDLYHANCYKYHIPKLGATCEAALANPGDVVESPCKIGQKSPMHGVISRMLGHQREGRSARIHQETGMCHPGRRVSDVNPFEVEREREAIAMPDAFSTSPCDSRHPLNEYHLALLEEEHERRDSVVSDSTTTSGLKGKLPANARHSGFTNVESERQGIEIPGVPHVARLRDRSPGGTPYSSPRLFHEIMVMLGSDGERSPMLYADLLSSKPAVERLSDAFHPDSPDAMMPWGLSMSPLLDNDLKPTEDTLHLVPAPLRASSKRKSNSYSTANSGLYGPRPLPSGHASQRSVTVQDLETKTLAYRPSQASVKDGMFSSLRGATRRAFNGKSKR